MAAPATTSAAEGRVREVRQDEATAAMSRWARGERPFAGTRTAHGSLTSMKKEAMTMTTSRKTILSIAGAALLLGACASDPYYGDRYSYGYQAGPAYYDPYYYGPAVGFGLASNDRDGDRWRERRFRDRDEHEHHDRDHDERG